MGKRVRSGYPSDVKEEEWLFVAPYLALCREDAPQRDYPLREVFNALRYVAKTGCHWRMLPNDLPPWTVVYQQMRRWIDARCFETMVEDLHILLRGFAGRKPQPTAMIVDSRTAVHTRVGRTRGLRWGQAAQGIEGPCSGGHAGPFAGASRYVGR